MRNVDAGQPISKNSKKIRKKEKEVKHLRQSCKNKQTSGSWEDYLEDSNSFNNNNNSNNPSMRQNHITH